MSLGLIAAVGATLLVLQPQQRQGCQPFWPTPNRTKALDLGFLKAHSRRTQGSIALNSTEVTRYFQSRDPRNFAVEVSIAEYGVAFRLPNNDAQNHFYRLNPSQRVVLVFSYGPFDWRFGGDFAAQAAPRSIPYSVGMVGLDAKDGSLLADLTPVCK
jgi:hypothetical protein